MGFQNDGSAIVKLAGVLLWTLVVGAIIFWAMNTLWEENLRLKSQLQQADEGAAQVAVQSTLSANTYARKQTEVMATVTHQAEVATWQDAEMQKLYAVNVTQAAQLTEQAQEIAAVRTAAAVTIANLPQVPATPAATRPGDSLAPAAPVPTATPKVGMNTIAVIRIDPNAVALILIGLSLVGIPVLALVGALIYKRSRRQG